MKEIEVYHLCEGHPNIVELLEYFEEDDKFYLIFEKISGGSLLEHIQKRRRLSEAQARVIMSNLAESLSLHHGQGIAHRDIKPANVLCTHLDSPCSVKLCANVLCTHLDSPCPVKLCANVLCTHLDSPCPVKLCANVLCTHLDSPCPVKLCANVLCTHLDSPCPVKLCDFDLCSAAHNGRRTPRLGTPVGSVDFMAPEVVNAFVLDEPVSNYPELYYDKKCDLCSLGVLMYILLCGYPSFIGQCGSDCGWHLGEPCEHCEAKLFSSIREGKFSYPDRDWSNISTEAKHLLESLLEKDVQSRLDAEDVLEHPWIINRGGSQKLGRKTNMRSVMKFSNNSGGVNRTEMEDWAFKNSAFSSGTSCGEESFSTNSFELSLPTYFNMELNRNW